jgi:hypothetical protein
MIIKSLIAVREAFIDGECRYVLNDLYINDYCTWIQYVRYTLEVFVVSGSSNG